MFALNPASFRSIEEAKGASWARKSALVYKDTQPVKHSRSFIRGNNVATLFTALFADLSIIFSAPLRLNGSRGETPTIEAMQQRVELDIWYIDNWSFHLDLAIIFRTIIEIVRGRNAY